MILNRWTKKNTPLGQLIQQSERWIRLEQDLQKRLPPNIAPFCHVICINQEHCLILAVDNNLVANRLRMVLPSLVPELQLIDSDIDSIHVKIKPRPIAKPKNKEVNFSDAALDSFTQAAKHVSDYPRLAQALEQFAQKRQSSK